MVTPNDVGWGSYASYEGPYFKGSRKFQIPQKLTEEARLMTVLTQTEGGAYDAINGYDKCALSTGIFQWCDLPYFLTTTLLGDIANKNLSLLDPLKPALEASNAEFKKNPRGYWRFHFKDPRGEVTAGTLQKQLYLLRSNGHIGSWDKGSKAHAKLWAASVANVLAQDGTIEVQIDYSAARMMSFATGSARKVLFDGTPSTGWTGAMRAIYLSFGGNLPAVAARQLDLALKDDPGPKWTKDWCIHIARRLTFGPNIAIYPHRYNKIRPVVERLYGVDLPDMASELKAWNKDMDMDPSTPWETIADEYPQEPTFTTTKEVQEFLLELNYDLGPAGVDGWMGRKTRDAVIMFQRFNLLVANGIVDAKTRAKMLELWRKKHD